MSFNASLIAGADDRRWIVSISCYSRHPVRGVGASNRQRPVAVPQRSTVRNSHPKCSEGIGKRKNNTTSSYISERQKKKMPAAILSPGQKRVPVVTKQALAFFSKAGESGITDVAAPDVFSALAKTAETLKGGDGMQAGNHPGFC